MNNYCNQPKKNQEDLWIFFIHRQCKCEWKKKLKQTQRASIIWWSNEKESLFSMETEKKKQWQETWTNTVHSAQHTENTLCNSSFIHVIVFKFKKKKVDFQKASGIRISIFFFYWFNQFFLGIGCSWELIVAGFGLIHFYLNFFSREIFLFEWEKERMQTIN